MLILADRNQKCQMNDSLAGELSCAPEWTMLPRIFARMVFDFRHEVVLEEDEDIKDPR